MRGRVGIVGIVACGTDSRTDRTTEPSYTHTFGEPGFYNVTCDIHATMRATMYVASTPYVGTADERGRFTFDNVVPGTYTLAGFADGKPIEKPVTIAGPRADVSFR